MGGGGDIQKDSRSCVVLSPRGGRQRDDDGGGSATARGGDEHRLTERPSHGRNRTRKCTHHVTV